ncbi:MAG TPA: helix-turn-helix domain-containing protein [Actinomycetes bacterium]|nr:helix-turn-helix domain-containing protein [Actinomycetes bacterium]
MAEQWTILSNHGRVLLVIADDPDVRLRDVAELVGITERAVQMIVADLEEAGYITRQRVGRRNHYVVDPLQSFRHPHEAGHQVGELLDIFRGSTATAARAAAKQSGAASAASAAAAAAAVAVTELTSGVPDLPI